MKDWPILNYQVHNPCQNYGAPQKPAKIHPLTANTSTLPSKESPSHINSLNTPTSPSPPHIILPTPAPVTAGTMGSISIPLPTQPPGKIESRMIYVPSLSSPSPLTSADTSNWSTISLSSNPLESGFLRLLLLWRSNFLLQLLLSSSKSSKTWNLKW